MSDRQKQSRLLLSEREKKRRNPTYARLQRKIFLGSLTFLLIPAALLCLGVSFEGIASQVIFLLFLFSLSLFTPFLLMKQTSRCISRNWVCPSCKMGLPVSQGRRRAVKYVAQCPYCGYYLEKEQESNLSAFSQEHSPCRGKAGVVVLGILISLYGFLMTLFFAGGLLIGEPLYQCLIGTAINLLPLVGGLLAIFGRNRKRENNEEVILESGKKSFWLGVSCAVIAVTMLFCASCVLTVDSLGVCAVFGIIGIFFLFCSLRQLLLFRTAKICLYGDGRIEVTSWTGRTSTVEFSKDTPLLLLLSPNGDVRLNLGTKKRWFPISLQTETAGLLLDWLEKHEISFHMLSAGEETLPTQLLKQADKIDWEKLEQEEEEELLSEEAVQDAVQQNCSIDWNEENETPLHSFLKPIRFGFYFVCLLSVLGVFLFFPMMSLVDDLILSVQILMFSPLLPYLYWAIFRDVFVFEKPENASKEWKKHYLSIPFTLTLFEELWMFPNITVLEQNAFATADKGRMVLLYFMVGAALGLIFLLRRPKQPKEGNSAISAVIMAAVLSFSLTYGLQVSFCRDVWHFPAEITGGEIVSDEDDTDYLLTVRLQDGKETEIYVQQKEYQAWQKNTPLRLCQRTGLLGIRMVNIHQ